MQTDGDCLYTDKHTHNYSVISCFVVVVVVLPQVSNAIHLEK